MTLKNINNNTSQLIFDLDTVEANKIYGDSYKNIYYHIQNFLSNNGFIHIQSSGYELNKYLNEDSIIFLIDDLKNI